MNTQRTKLRQEEGAVLVESIIVLPVLMLLLFGTIQFGLILSAHITVRNASAVAARTASLDGSSDGASIRQAARDALEPMLDSTVVADANITITDKTVNGEVATEVSINYPFSLFIPFVVPGQNGGVLNLVASSTMR